MNTTWIHRPLEFAKLCTRCGVILQELLFLGVEPDGYVCPSCKVYYATADSDRPTATVIC
jgi:hypothetical protein